MDSVSRSSEGAAPNRQGWLKETLVRLLMRRASVASSEPVGPGFQLITLEGAKLRGVSWIPGQKLQIVVNSAFESRTFTPVDWDSVKGQTRIVAHVHGPGLASDWIRAAKPGDMCDVLGPRASLDMTGLASPALLFGDETSFGLALATVGQQGSPALESLFEVNAPEAAQGVLQKLGMERFELFARKQGDDHLKDIEPRLATAAVAGATFILTGKATSIQRLRRCLKSLNVPSARIMTRAYWMPGKSGLD